MLSWSPELEQRLRVRYSTPPIKPLIPLVPFDFAFAEGTNLVATSAPAARIRKEAECGTGCPAIKFEMAGVKEERAHEHERTATSHSFE